MTDKPNYKKDVSYPIDIDSFPGNPHPQPDTSKPKGINAVRKYLCLPPKTKCHNVEAVVGVTETMHYECPKCHQPVNIDGSNPTQPDTTIDGEVEKILAFIYTKPKVNGKAIEGESVNKTYVKSAITNLIAQEANKAQLLARKDELHLLGESMLTQKGLMWVIARNQELKDALAVASPPQ